MWIFNFNINSNAYIYIGWEKTRQKSFFGFELNFQIYILVIKLWLH